MAYPKMLPSRFLTFLVSPLAKGTSQILLLVKLVDYQVRRCSIEPRLGHVPPPGLLAYSLTTPLNALITGQVLMSLNLPHTHLQLHACIIKYTIADMGSLIPDSRVRSRLGSKRHGSGLEYGADEPTSSEVGPLRALLLLP
jgi:hypothetical protein